MPYAAINDLKMFFEEHGRPDRAHLLLHSSNATGGYWRERTIPQLARATIALCAELGLGQPIFCGPSPDARPQRWNPL
jgi:hypothetical protein